MQARTIAVAYLACATVVGCVLVFGDEEAFGLSFPRALQFTLLASAPLAAILLRLGVLRRPNLNFFIYFFSKNCFDIIN